MGKILLENSTQKFEEVFLFGEAVSSDESFTSIETYFGEINLFRGEQKYGFQTSRIAY